MLVLFLVLIIAPLIVRNMDIALPTIPMDLMQPLDKHNNDTMTSYTGAGLKNGMKPVASPSSYL
jgi:1,3-beta-glucan synthase